MVQQQKRFKLDERNIEELASEHAQAQRPVLVWKFVDQPNHLWRACPFNDTVRRFLSTSPLRLRIGSSSKGHYLTEANTRSLERPLCRSSLAFAAGGNERHNDHQG